MNPDLKKKIIYINYFFINLITLKNIFAQLGLNLAHLLSQINAQNQTT